MRSESSSNLDNKTLRRLARFHSARHGVLSLYLNLDPAGGERRAVRGAAQGALQSLEDGSMPPRLRARLQDERERVATFLDDRFEVQGRSLILFSCQPRDLWDVFQLQVDVRTLARFKDRPVISQLVGVIDEHERYGVVLVDKDQGRIMSVYLNEITHDTQVFKKYAGRTAAGGWAQARYARHREDHLRRHLLHVVEAVEAERRRRPFDRLIVGGPDETRAAFLDLLPRGLRSVVAGTCSIELLASDRKVLEIVRAIEEEAERKDEQRLIREVIGIAKGGGRATLAWPQTLSALAEGRVHKLLVAEGVTQRGWACPTGHFATIQPMVTCPMCSDEIQPVANLAEWAVKSAFDTEATVETLRGEPRRQLTAEGGVGAVLRY